MNSTDGMAATGADECPTFEKHNRPTLACIAIVSLWLALVVGGMAVLAFHAATPGRQGPAPARWPISSRLLPSPNKANLLVFAHPYCPCTRATLGELTAIMTACNDRVQTHVLFVVPGDIEPGWTHSDAWLAAAEIPGVRMAADVDGVEAARFGAETSGQALLFDLHGSRLFAGGITAARGHAGDNLGRQAVVEWITDGRSVTTTTPTFGCRVSEEGGAARGEDLP